VISSAGIFLIHDNKYAWQSHLITYISYLDLISIYYSNQTASFSSRNKQIRIKSEHIQTITSLVFLIRQSQFPTDLVPLNLDFGEFDFQKQLPPTSLYKLDQIFLDRVISCVLYLGITINDTVENLIGTIEPLSSRKYYITQELIDSPLFPAISLSISYEQEIHNFHISNSSLSKVISSCVQIFKINRFVKTVVIENCSFIDSAAAIKNCFSVKHNFKPYNWEFLRCDLSNSDFLSFFENLHIITSKVSALSFKECIIKDSRGVFQTIFFDDCFHHLESVSIDPFVNEPSLKAGIEELTGCSWIFENKCLRNIEVKNCKVELSESVTTLIRFNIGLSYINLSGNSFLNPIHCQINQKITSLVISNSEMNSSFLQSLFSLIFSGQLMVYNLDLSEMIISQTNHKYFLSTVIQGDKKIPYLTQFSYNNNEMDSNMSINFSKLINRMDCLTSLSLNKSISIMDSPEGFISLMSVLSSKQITWLSMIGDGTMKMSLGQLLVNYLPKIINNLRYLDVSFQCIGSNGIRFLLSILNKGIEEIYFDGSMILSYEELTIFCEMLYKSSIKCTEFPYSDFQRILKYVSPSLDISELTQNISTIQKAFLAKYKREKIKVIIPKDSMRNTQISVQMVTKKASFPSINPPPPIQLAITRDPELEKLFNECIDTNDPSFIEPIYSLWKGIHNQVL